MKKFIILAVGCMLFTSVLHAQDTLRLMTYNISAGEMADMQQLGSYINSIHPDIVALQEVDYQTNRSYMPKDRGKNQPGELAFHTNMLPIFGSIKDYPTGGYYGMGFLSKNPILTVSNIPLPQVVDKHEPRSIIVAQWNINGKQITIANTHLSLDIKNREVQLKYIRKYMKKVKGLKFICGDFNSTYSEGLVLKTFSKWNDALPYMQLTFPNQKPNSKYDWILYEKSAHIQVLNAVVDTSCQLSDHLPCYIDFVIK